MNVVCEKCAHLGLRFSSIHIQPHEYIEGKSNAEIWVIGLNPKGSIGGIESRNIQAFEDFKPNPKGKEHSYFHDFRKVSSKLYDNYLSTDSNVAFTDLVKCFSLSFPLKNHRKHETNAIINNCSTHLHLQINQYKPKVIICNGSFVCKEMIRLFPPQGNTESELPMLTSYKTRLILENRTHEFWIILSGFIGRIDDRNKRRLGNEIEAILEKEQIIL
jgi:hypothetical protein